MSCGAEQPTIIRAISGLGYHIRVMNRIIDNPKRRAMLRHDHGIKIILVQSQGQRQESQQIDGDIVKQHLITLHDAPKFLKGTAILIAVWLRPDIILVEWISRLNFRVILINTRTQFKAFLVRGPNMFVYSKVASVSLSREDRLLPIAMTHL